MNLSTVIARVRSECPAFRSVGGAADLDAAIASSVPNLPVAFVIPLRYQALAPSENTGAHMQPLLDTFAVVVVVSNRRDAIGNAALVDLEAARAPVCQALAGWVPDANSGEPVQIVGGRLLSFGDGRLWWGDEFSVNSYFWRD